MHSKTYITVRYAETDKMGVAHHANYPIWYEIGRTDFIKMFGTSYSEMEEAGVMTPVLNLTCHYGKPAMFEDKLIVRTWCIHMTAARIEFAYSIKKILDNGTEVELGYGTTEHGVVDAKTFKPCNIKKKLPQLYEKMNESIKII